LTCVVCTKWPNWSQRILAFNKNFTLIF
jgi:hypothetical protein